MAGVFVSYRRTDSAYALLLYKALAQKFGSARVFRDFESIAPGQDFVNVLDAALRQSAACVVIVGKGWLDAIDRLASADDFVRREIAAILERGTLLIPCLVGGSNMPAPTALPEALAAFLRKDAMTIGDEYFDRDADILLAALDSALSRVPEAAAPDGGSAYRQQRAIELLKRQVSRLQVRAIELIEANEVDRARDELAEGFDVIMQLLEWSPGDVPLDLQLGYLCKTQAQVQDAAGERDEANRSLELAFAMFNRIGDTGAGAASEKASAFNGLGNVYYARGDLDAAIRNYRRALDLMPDYAYARHDLLLALMQRAEQGRVDLPAMEDALSKLEATAGGLPGLGAAHMAELERLVARWRRTGAARATTGRGPRKTSGKKDKRRSGKSESEKKHKKTRRPRLTRSVRRR
jgi:tetratricopeptide (TPR) repeat protein